MARTLRHARSRGVQSKCVISYQSVRSNHATSASVRHHERRQLMKRLTASLATTFLFLALGAIPALADSSGNFTATGTSAACVATPATFNSDTGDFQGNTLS